MFKDRFPKKFFGWGLVFLFLIVLDQLVKDLTARQFLNYQFAFSLPLPAWLMYLLYALILGTIFIYCGKNFSEFHWQQALAWLLIIAGAVSNIGERIILGYVRDYVYIFTGVFNLADGYIIAGIIILLFCSSKQSKIKPVSN